MTDAECERRQFNIFYKKRYFPIQKIPFEKKDTTIIFYN